MTKRILVGIMKGIAFAFAMFTIISIIKNNKKRVTFSNKNDFIYIPTNREQSELKNDLYYSKHELEFFSKQNIFSNENDYEMLN